MAGHRQFDARGGVFADLDPQAREDAKGGAARGAHGLGGPEILHVDSLLDGRVRDGMFADQSLDRVSDATKAFKGCELGAQPDGDAREEAHRFSARVDDGEASAAQRRIDAQDDGATAAPAVTSLGRTASLGFPPAW